LFWLSRKKVKIEAEGREFAKSLISPEQYSTIIETEYYLTCPWRFFRSNMYISEQFKLKFEKIIGI
jgi:hypothetical protein